MNGMRAYDQLVLGKELALHFYWLGNFVRLDNGSTMAQQWLKNGSKITQKASELVRLPETRIKRL